MEPSSASRSWGKSASTISTDSSPRYVPPSVDSVEPAAGSGPRRAARPERVRQGSITRAVADAIVEDTTDPANRFYRYPAARALLPILGRISWLTPNHVT